MQSKALFKGQVDSHTYRDTKQTQEIETELIRHTQQRDRRQASNTDRHGERSGEFKFSLSLCQDSVFPRESHFIYIS